MRSCVVLEVQRFGRTYSLQFMTTRNTLGADHSGKPAPIYHSVQHYIPDELFFLIISVCGKINHKRSVEKNVLLFILSGYPTVGSLLLQHEEQYFNTHLYQEIYSYKTCKHMSILLKI
jgi:hypothetical protein